MNNIFNVLLKRQYVIKTINCETKMVSTLPTCIFSNITYSMGGRIEPNFKSEQ